jgi:DNA topoisomerase-6 subunit B
MMLKMLHDTKSHSLAGFLSSEFSRVSAALAQEIAKTAKLSPNLRPRDIHGAAAEALYRAIQSTKIMAPPSNCISPIGEKAILHGLYKQIKGDFYTAVTRPPAVYRGNPFIIEAGLAFGKGPDQANEKPGERKEPLAEGEGEEEDNELARVIRYANRVPLLYQQSACATFKAVLDTSWRNYGIGQSRGALPAGPMVIFIHMASVWVPFTSESKEAIADYDEIRKEIRLALQECGRRLGVFVRRREHAKSEFRRRNIFELYIEEVVEACNRLKGGKLPTDKLKDQLQKIALKRTGGQKTDELLGRDRSGPEGLPDSIIVTPDGVEGDAPVLPAGPPADSQDGAAELELDIQKSAPQAPANATPAKAAAQGRAAKSKNKTAKHPAKVGAPAPDQMSLGFEKSAPGAKRNAKAEEKNGPKKRKK